MRKIIASALAAFSFYSASLGEALAFASGWGTNPPLLSATIGSAYAYNTHYSTYYFRGDTFASTVCDDGNLYFTTGDTQEGFQGATSGGSNVALNTMSPAYTATMSNYVGTTANGMTAWGAENTTSTVDNSDFKPTGITCIGGVIYMALTRFNPSTGLSQNATIIKSSNHGSTWSPAAPTPAAAPYSSPMFSGTGFAYPFFVNYSANNASNPNWDNAQTYTYAVSSATGDATHVYLGRVLTANIGNLSASDWSFYSGSVGGNVTNASNWSSSISSATPIYTNTGSTSAYAPSVYWIPFKNRYLMLSYGEASVTNTTWYIYEAPHLSGPWTLIGSQNNSNCSPQNSGFCGTYYPFISAASIYATNGKNVQVLTAGDYNYNSISSGAYTLTFVQLNLQ